MSFWTWWKDIPEPSVPEPKLKRKLDQVKIEQAAEHFLANEQAAYGQVLAEIIEDRLDIELRRLHDEVAAMPPTEHLRFAKRTYREEKNEHRETD